MRRACVVSTAGTGEGKTLVALALTHALAADGYDVAPFKVGPDFIDAKLYEQSCGQRARNLDLWLDGETRVLTELQRAHERGAAIVLEGMMGLHDGDDEGATSTAHIAAAADIPVVLVIDGWRVSQTAAAIALGCASMAPRVHLLGVILNRCGGASHADAVRRACANVGIELLATLPYDATWTMPERHLGLDVRNTTPMRTAIEAAAEILRRQIDLRAIFGEPQPSSPHAGPPVHGPTIAHADDDALWFTYPQTLEALRAAGANCVAFSPLRDASLPPNTAGVWLGGGYPEAHGAALARNVTLRREIATLAAEGSPIYAECGGMMYLAQELETPDGCFPMVGALRGRTSIASPALHIGYRKARATRDSVLDDAGTAFHAYEFHYATGALDELPAYECETDRGAWRPNILASFLHRRFFVGDATIARFVERARR